MKTELEEEEEEGGSTSMSLTSPKMRRRELEPFKGVLAMGRGCQGHYCCIWESSKGITDFDLNHKINPILK